MKHLPHPVRHLLHRPRMISSVALALVLFVALLPWMPATRAALIAFNLGALLFLGLMSALMFRVNVLSMKERARVLDEGRWTVLLVTLGVAVVVLAALSHELHAAKAKSVWDLGLAASTLVLAWLFVAVVFAEHYAHTFYVRPGQLQFPGTAEPDYWDFSYFAGVISMCCQTSDVAVTDSGMRRLVLLHSVLAFFFNVVILAITVNVVAGVL